MTARRVGRFVAGPGVSLIDRLGAIDVPADALWGAQRRVHPDDPVNLGQSSGDVFPSAMPIAVAEFDTRVDRGRMAGPV